ncbi:alkaline phosphatase [Maribacter caenipelagi]|uniref:Alkaline phosphatase n=1 Tax=Maribacter caenipelagi TaxID=1447781 RepID=A0A4V6Q019_9FLAO|nr:alkaline phosphatase [Maribacter caenipelagi]TDS16638.1 alkaline phosphatase [Maribacter caenipelagi]
MRFKRLSIICLFLIVVCSGFAQEYKIHSHNDYKQNIPFWKAFGAEVQSIEVDVFYEDGELFVAHEVKEINENKTLQRLYLEPLKEALSLQMMTNRSLQLVIDVKTDAVNSLNAIVSILKQYPTIINNKDVRIVISGNRPDLKEYVNYPEYILFDYHSVEPITDLKTLDKIAMVSVSFKNFSEWNGKGRLTAEDYARVTDVIHKAHQLNKPFRFWATPDSKSAWKAFVNMGVDFINTDQPNECVAYVSTISQRVVQNTVFSEVYRPTFASDKAKRNPKNIILMIGDGNGLTQISSTVLANNGELSLTQLKSIGFIKTQSADDFTTDSAGAGTAIATGEKTNNRAIGTNAMGDNIPNIVEILSKNGFNTGVITTDEITGATPSSFFAHRTDRGMVQEIASDLNFSELELFISQHTSAVHGIEEVGYQMKTEIKDIGISMEEKVGAWFNNTKDETLESYVERLSVATKNGLSFLANKKESFFLMTEGAKIDSYGHENKIEGVINESISFDKAISEALKFADTNKNTLVIITADHETGGLTIPQGNVDKHEIEADFTTHDHTGTMVPIFAYGPMS